MSSKLQKGDGVVPYQTWTIFFPPLLRSSSSWLMGKTAQFTNEAYPSLAHNFLTVTILKVTLIDGIEILWESRRTASERWILWRTNAAAAVDFGRSFMRITSLIGNETRKWRLECKWRRTPPRGHFMVLLHFVLGTRRNPIRFFINSFNWEANAKKSLHGDESDWKCCLRVGSDKIA